MKRKLGIVCIVLGLGMLLGALAIYGCNELESERAGISAQHTVELVREQIQQSPEKETVPAETAPSSPQMTVVDIDGFGYIGYVSIPRLKLELPVMDQWDEARLKIAPCRYSGTTMEDDLVLMAHNYRRHFGPIRRLNVNDEVIFVDMDGQSITYLVAATDVVSPKSVEDVTSGAYDLTLFTCTYGGESRVVVYCNRAVPDSSQCDS